MQHYNAATDCLIIPLKKLEICLATGLQVIDTDGMVFFG